MSDRRNTRQRQLVLDVVRSRCDHPTAEQVFSAVHEQDQHVSRATVYRNLHVLAEEGDIRAVHTFGAEHFDLRLDEHPHIVCVRCGRVVDAPVEWDATPGEGLTDTAGWQIRARQLIFEGVCPNCANV